MNPNPNKILNFWFADALHFPEAAAARFGVWFGQDDQFDQQIREQFGDLPERAARQEFEAWRNDPQSCLALVLVLDQFPRNIFRGSARTSAFDGQARKVALAAIASGFDERLHPLEAAFLYLPLQHAEDLDLQNRSVQLYDALCERAPTCLKILCRRCAEYARRHREVIRRFGRFPHRNALLGRESSQEESAYLAAGGETFSGEQR